MKKIKIYEFPKKVEIKGLSILTKNVGIKRPGYGISPLDKKKVLGKKAVKNILPNTLIFQKDMY